MDNYSVANTLSDFLFSFFLFRENLSLNQKKRTRQISRQSQAVIKQPRKQLGGMSEADT